MINAGPDRPGTYVLLVPNKHCQCTNDVAQIKHFADCTQLVGRTLSSIFQIDET